MPEAFIHWGRNWEFRTKLDTSPANTPPSTAKSKGYGKTELMMCIGTWYSRELNDPELGQLLQVRGIVANSRKYDALLGIDQEAEVNLGGFAYRITYTQK